MHVVIYSRRTTDGLERLFKCLVLVCASCAGLSSVFDDLVWVRHEDDMSDVMSYASGIAEMV